MKILIITCISLLMYLSINAQKIGIGRTGEQIIDLYGKGFEINAEFYKDRSHLLILESTTQKWIYGFNAFEGLCIKTIYIPKTAFLLNDLLDYNNKNLLKLSENLWVFKYTHPVSKKIIDIAVKKYIEQDLVCIAYINPEGN